MDIRYKTIKELRQLLDDKKITAQELIQKTLSMIESDDSNAVLHISDEIALQQLKKELPQTLLSGIPVIYKDNFNIIATPTTCASKMLENYVSPYDATGLWCGNKSI